ncbi:uncharacterized protein [Leptinotarsa decemlineata]|uniref:uncharacterized protein n=1 Tax=Leptinotarsa decemlineata TaxID=7539 RepID=UPI003D30C020
MSTMFHFVATLAFILVLSTITEGRSGCLNYGHSCFGGVAKRHNDQNEYSEGEKYFQNDENVESTDNQRFLYQSEQPQIFLEPRYAEQLRIFRQWLQHHRMAFPAN